MTPQSPGIRFRPDIQGLRAVAVVLVVLAHAGMTGFAGGYVGVDVFFVLSGYLITGLLLEERLATGRIAYGQFLARRLRRLLPAMLTMLLLVLAIAAVLLTAFEMRMQSRSFPYAAAWISNFFFAFAERDYFLALQDEDLFLHTWSLGVEEQFYLIWPWLVLWFAGLSAVAAGRENVGKRIAVSFAVVGSISLLLSLYLTSANTILAFYMMPARIWQFALGAIVYAVVHVAGDSDGSVQQPVGTFVAGLAGAALIVGSGVLLRPDIAYPGWYALAPSVGAALLLASGAKSPGRGIAAVLESRPMMWVGDRSYSIYLWHWPLLVLGNAMGATGSPAGVVAIVAIAFLLADLSYRFVEIPFWKGRFRAVIPRHVIVHAATAIIVSTTVFLVLERQVFGVTGVTLTAEGDIRNDADARVYAAGRGCDQGHFGADIVPCPLGEPGAPHLAVLLGDSIGAQWSPTLSGVLRRPDWQILVLTKSACGIVDKTWYYDKAGGDYLVCTEWRNTVLDYLADSQPDIVFVGSSARYEFTSDDWVGGTRRVLDKLAPSVGQVVLVAGTPQLTFDGPSCLEDPWRFSFRLIDGQRECEEVHRDNRPALVATHLATAALGHSNVHVLDLGDIVCPDGRCAAATPDGAPVFRDQAHITASFAFSVVAQFRHRLVTLGINLTPPERSSD